MDAARAQEVIYASLMEHREEGKSTFVNCTPMCLTRAVLEGLAKEELVVMERAGLTNIEGDDSDFQRGT